MAWVSLATPVTLLAGENEPMSSGRAAYLTSFRSGASESMCPSPSWAITTTSATDSRHGSSLQSCSKGPMNTTGRCGAAMVSSR